MIFFLLFIIIFSLEKFKPYHHLIFLSPSPTFAARRNAPTASLLQPNPGTPRTVFCRSPFNSRSFAVEVCSVLFFSILFCFLCSINLKVGYVCKGLQI